MKMNNVGRAWVRSVLILIWGVVFWTMVVVNGGDFFLASGGVIAGIVTLLAINWDLV